MSQKSISMNLRNDHIAILYAKIKNKMGHANLYDLESINRSMQGSTYLKTANAFGKITFINHVQLCTIHISWYLGHYVIKKSRGIKSTPFFQIT